MSRGQVEERMRAGEASGTEYEYRATSYCQTGDPDSGNADDVCLRAYVACRNQGIDAGLGPATRIWRRAVSTPPSPWELRVVTCFPDLADGPSGPTMADIVAAFHDTDFAKAGVNIQPEGDVTLVTLPTFLEARFPDTGFEPGEVDTVTLVGVPVDIRPGLNSITYHLGDGRTLGPTASMGGPHPTGDVVTTYPKAGTFDVRADVTYTGQFRIAGGEWIDIPGTVTIDGGPVSLTVATAQSRLVNPRG